MVVVAGADGGAAVADAWSVEVGVIGVADGAVVGATDSGVDTGSVVGADGSGVRSVNVAVTMGAGVAVERTSVLVTGTVERTDGVTMTATVAPAAISPPSAPDGNAFHIQPIVVASNTSPPAIMAKPVSIPRSRRCCVMPSSFTH